MMIPILPHVISWILQAGIIINAILIKECSIIYICIGYTTMQRSVRDLHNQGPRPKDIINSVLTEWSGATNL